MRTVLLLTAALALAGCDEHPRNARPYQEAIGLQDPAGVVHEPSGQPAEVEHHSSALCMPCVGPHISLSTGKMEVLSLGPGLSF